MMRAFFRSRCCILAGLAACSSRQALFVVLPNPAAARAPSPSTMAGSRWWSISPTGRPRCGGSRRRHSGQDQVQQDFGNALAAQPILPAISGSISKSDSEVLTPASARI